MKKKDTTSDEGSAWGSAPAGRITPQDVQQKEFRVARFGAGYRMREVDEFLDQVTDAMSALVAESERLQRGSADPGSASGRPSAPPSRPPSADDAGRTAVDAFLRREKGFLQDLGGLVQTHAEELRSMVRDVRRDAPAPVADTAPVEEPAVESAPTPVSSPEASRGPSPDVSPGPSPEAPKQLDAPHEEIAQGPELGATEQAIPSSEVPDDHTKGDDPDASGRRQIATTEAVAEEPIRVDEPEPARSRRSEEEGDGSLRELFWGEE
jgi:DivIVA domain-containing protein